MRGKNINVVDLRTKNELSLSEWTKKREYKFHRFAGVDIVSNSKVHVLRAAATQRTIVHLATTWIITALHYLLDYTPITIINNNNNHDNVYGAVIITRVLREFIRFIWWMQTERRVATDPQTKSIDLKIGCYHPHPSSPLLLLLSP